ncbi:MAG TPA: FkbM family methyltransferase [Candidatus Eisenbacteria bacterium]|nr:FkbM family methyltransferase [Candidatus Eisenbacteria bacterium]
MRRLLRGGARLWYRARGFVPTRIEGALLRGDPDHIGFWRDVARGAWEPGTFAFLRDHLSATSTFLDVGAWIGPVTLAAARRCAAVYCFEPDPAAYRYLLWNLELNGVRNASPYHAALGSRTGTRTLSGRDGAFGTSRSTLLASAGAPEIGVPCWGWQDWLEAVRPGRIDAIKVDVEGGEFELLPAMGEYLRTERPALHLSLHAELPSESGRGAGLAGIGEAVRHYRTIRDEDGRGIALEQALDLAAARNVTLTFSG